MSKDETFMLLGLFKKIWSQEKESIEHFSQKEIFRRDKESDRECTYFI